MRTQPTLLLAASLIGFLGAPLSGQCIREETAMLLGSNAAIADAFGKSVAAEGDVLVIGSPFHTVGAATSGAAYIVRRTQDGAWQEETILLAADRVHLDNFGFAVGYDGTRAIVGAIGHDHAPDLGGAAYVFVDDGTGWVEEQELFPTDGNSGDWYGRSVDICDDVAVVGAGFHDSLGADSGAAYVYRRQGSRWNLEQKLTGSDTTRLNQFGFSVAVDRDVIVVGAPFNSTDAVNSGRAYVFRFHPSGTWLQEAILTSPAPAADEWFGLAVDVEGNAVAVGAPRDDDAGVDTGSGFLFRQVAGSWIQEAQLTAVTPVVGDAMGVSVSLRGDRLLVGASHVDTPTSDAGVAFLYRRVTGTLWVDEQFQVRAPAIQDRLGSATALLEDTAFVAASSYDPNGLTNAGAVFTFDVPDIVLDADPNSVTAGTLLTFTACGGVPGNPMRMFTAAINGIPLFQPVLSGAFGITGQWTISATVPNDPTLPGNTISFVVFTINSNGNIVESNHEPVSFF